MSMLTLLNNQDIKTKILSTNFFSDNDYLDKYIHLILSNGSQTDRFERQKHHIIPRSYFKIVNLKIDNSDNNTVYLSYSDHILAHYYLYFCTSDVNLKRKLGIAFEMMSNEFISYFDVTNLDRYDELYSQNIEARSYVAKTRKRTPIAQETKNKISLANSGRYVGDIWVNKDGHNKHIKKSLLSYYLSCGYKVGRDDPEACKKISDSQKKNPNRSMLGRKQTDYQKKVVGDKLRGVSKSDVAKENMRSARVGKVYMHDPISLECHLVGKDEVDKYIDFGYVFGRVSRKTM